MRASIRIARLSIHGIMPAGLKVLGREIVRMGHLLWQRRWPGRISNSITSEVMERVKFAW
jgi:hypothetical protein